MFARLLPQSLIWRVYTLYTATLLLFVGSSLVLFYQYQYNEAVEEAQRSATPRRHRRRWPVTLPPVTYWD